eukprot:scaffold224224_cov28-Tisochrysis_lutea.AAC.14
MRAVVARRTHATRAHGSTRIHALWHLGQSEGVFTGCRNSKGGHLKSGRLWSPLADERCGPFLRFGMSWRGKGRQIDRLVMRLSQWHETSIERIIGAHRPQRRC